jgi:hypothetical protein
LFLLLAFLANRAAAADAAASDGDNDNGTNAVAPLPPPPWTINNKDGNQSDNFMAFLSSLSRNEIL